MVLASLSQRKAMPTTSFGSPREVICQVASSSDWKHSTSVLLDEAASMSSMCMMTIEASPLFKHCVYTHHSHLDCEKPQLRKEE